MSVTHVWSPADAGLLELHNARAEPTVHAGRASLWLAEDEMGSGALAMLPDLEFNDGAIEALVAATVRPDAAPDMRGFVGLAFRVQPAAVRYECFFLRPTNARADNQLRRNHSTQYVAHPDHPWHRLRQESPGVYESYTDLEPGAWTRMRIEVAGPRARLLVNGADQPCLIVNDLKLGERSGSVALWIGAGTEAWFAELTVAGS